MIGPSSDADAIEGVHHPPPSPPPFASSSSSPSSFHPDAETAHSPEVEVPALELPRLVDNEQSPYLEQALNRFARLSHGPSSQSHSHCHTHTSYFPVPRRQSITSSSSSFPDCPDSASSLDVHASMSSLDQPVFDGCHEDSDFDDMESTHSSDGYSPAFNPSLPSLSVPTRDMTEPDMLSLSGDTVSNADTVSDRFDGQEDSEASFEQITLEDIPVELGGLPEHDAEELDQGIFMSDHTIMPPTPTLSQRLAHIDRSPSPALAPRQEESELRIMDLSKADKPYVLPATPLRLLFVAEEDMDEEHQLLIVAKIVSAAVGHAIHIDAIRKVYTSADESATQPYHQRYSVLVSKHKTVFVCTDHAVAYTEKMQATLKCGTLMKLSGANLPHFAIFFHTESDLDALTPPMLPGPFPYGEQGRQLSKVFASREVPMLEISLAHCDAPWLRSVLADTKSEHPDLPFLHARTAFLSGFKATAIGISHRPVPIPLDMFLDQVDDDSLSLHLAYLSRKRRSKTERAESPRAKTISTPPAMDYFRYLFPFLSLCALVLTYGFYFGKNTGLDPLSDLTIRQEALSIALNKSAITSVEPSNVLHYPTTTGVTAGTTTIGMAFPTTAQVHVAKSDQLFVAMPTSYRSGAYIGLLRNNQNVIGCNATKLIDGVYMLELNPAEAYGEINVDLRSTTTPTVNETIKVYLGNRLAQRATYENAARHVQQDFQRDVEEVHTAAKAVQEKVFNNTHTALKVSALRARALRDTLSGTANNAAHQLSVGLHEATNATSSFAKTASNMLTSTVKKDVEIACALASFARNATLKISSKFTSSLPRKHDLARARANSLKLKEKLLRRPAVSNVKDTAAKSALMRLKGLGNKVQQRSQGLYAKVLAPRFAKFLSKPDGSGPARKPGKRAKSVSSSTNPQQKALAKHGGLAHCKNMNSNKLKAMSSMHKPMDKDKNNQKTMCDTTAKIERK